MHIFGVKINRFFFDFGVIFLPEGTPGASRAALFYRWGSGSVFLMIFRSPGEGFGAPFGPFGLPWGDLGFHFADLGPHFAAQSGHKRRKKNVSSAHRVPETILGAKREGPGPS